MAWPMYPPAIFNPYVNEREYSLQEVRSKAGGPSMSNHGRGGSGPVKWCTSNFGGPLGPVKVETAVGPQRLCAPQADFFCRALRAPNRI